MKRIYLSAYLWLALANSAFALDRFNLVNTDEFLHTFEFCVERTKYWSPGFQIPSQMFRPVTLESDSRHFLRCTREIDGVKRDLGWFDFHSILAGLPPSDEPPSIKLEFLKTVEMRTSVVQEKKTRIETRTNEYKHCKMVPEQRCCTYLVYNPYNGCYYEFVRCYTECKPVWESRTHSYQVEVPYYVSVEKEDRVQIERPQLRIDINGTTRIIAPVDLPPPR